MRTGKNVLRLFLICLLTLTAVAHAKIDLVPVSLKFREGLDDDVSMSYSQHTYVYVKNVGNRMIKTMKPIKVSLNGALYQGYLYGPDSSGGMLSGPVGVDQIGKIFLRLPLDTLSHCQKVHTRIDATRRVQVGSNVFTNDYKRLIAHDLDSNLFCLQLPPRRRIPIDLIKLPSNLIIE